MKTKLTGNPVWAAATDAGNRSMRKAGRTAWNSHDFDAARLEFVRLAPKRENVELKAAKC